MEGSSVISTGQAQSLLGATVTPPFQEYCTIPLTKGQVAIVDAEDYEKLACFNWQAHWDKSTNTFYAKRNSRVAEGLKENTSIWMHREIMGLKVGDRREVDHIEAGNTLDNRRCNLRIATRAQNQHNQRTPKSNKSGFRGVSWSKQFRKWKAQIHANGKGYHLGYFNDPRIAHEAYKNASVLYHGEFGRTV